MAVQSDFRIIAVNEYIGTDPSALNTDFPFVGENSSVKHFQIDGVPVDDAYLLISHSRFRLTWHAVKINNRDLPWIEIFPSQEADHSGWLSCPRVKHASDSGERRGGYRLSRCRPLART
jgi:hypothetical protein